ncbi:L-cystine transporter [Photobacterium gaetbulicola]|uniref:Putative sodium/dicarboxylate symporter n=1 Tax=Photobacterium gaetbulicola Gung47 TaxID=658445 RepID=A0A0C5WP81_9GAMM|nr:MULTISPECIES: L-cystine transporter [Photobacterium]AJR08157.1 putative sodium/dicarboxylate symporter [Photobacterium gaetbulicola Gung47]PSU13036.1 L-cystine transporter [Photobacterium gaetbulicola]WEM43348.1 L-cystine transporter [Photobacterium sp. DA100]
MFQILNLAVFAIIIALLVKQQKSEQTLSKRVFTALGLGVLFGGALQLVYGGGSDVIAGTLEYINIVGAGYVSLLKMIIMPLITVSIIGAIIKVKDSGSLGKISGLSIGILLATTAASALIGILISSMFGLSAEGIVQGAREIARGEMLETRLTSVEAMSFADMIISFFPANPFADLAGSRPTSTIAVVIFSAFVGVAGLTVIRTQPELGASFEKFINVAQEVVRTLVRMVLSLTPYGVLALMTKVVAGSNYDDILSLLNFVVASYVGLGLILVMHLVLVAFVGVNPIRYLKKILPVLTFAFTSRSSAGTIPLNVETQVKKLGNGDAVSNFSASFGATMGQNGCAGLYPAMLAVMIAPTVGINPLDPGFMITLIAIVTISSFGIAGVGGGATFAALIVLSALDMPVALAGLLISIEPLIDMGRTAVNVSGAMTAGTITSRVLGQADNALFESDADIEEQTAKA